MSFPYFTVTVSSLSFAVEDPPTASGAESPCLQIRCDVVDEVANPIRDVWRKGNILKPTRKLNDDEHNQSDTEMLNQNRPSSNEVVFERHAVEYHQNSRAVALNAEILNRLTNGFLRLELLDTNLTPDTPPESQNKNTSKKTTGAPEDDKQSSGVLAAAFVSIAPFISSNKLHGAAHSILLSTTEDGNRLASVHVEIQIDMSKSMWTYCRRANTVAIHQVMINNLPEEWNNTAAQSEYTVELQMPIGSMEANNVQEDGAEEEQQTSLISMALPSAKLVGGTLTWLPNGPAATAIYLGQSTDETVALCKRFLDRQTVARFRAAVRKGKGMTIHLNRFAPDPKVKKGKEPQIVQDVAAACAAALPLDGAGDAVSDSLLENGATSIAAAVPLQPQNPVDGHPVTIAQSAIFLAIKLASPLSSSHGARISGGQSIAGILGSRKPQQLEQDQIEPEPHCFTSVQQSKLVIRRHLRETMKILLAELTAQRSGNAPAELNERQIAVQKALQTNGFGDIITKKFRHAVAGLLRERFRANQLNIANARQASSVLIDISSYLEAEVEAVVSEAGANLQSSSRSGGALNPLLVLAYDAENDGDQGRALQFHHSHVAEVSAQASALTAQPEAASAWCELGRCHVRLGQLLQGTIVLQDALRCDPGCVGAAASLAAVLLQKQLHASRKVASASDFARALELLSTVVTTDNPEVSPNTADEICNLALAISKHRQCTPLPQGNSSDQNQVVSHFKALNFILQLRLAPLAQAALDALGPLVSKLPRNAHLRDELHVTLAAYSMEVLHIKGDHEEVVTRAEALLEALRRRARVDATASSDGEEIDTKAAPEEVEGETKVENGQDLKTEDKELCTDACFWRVLAQSYTQLGRPLDALDAFENSLACVDEVFNWDRGCVPSRVRLLLSAGDLCNLASPAGLDDPTRALEYFKTAATLGACPSVWFRLGTTCARLGATTEAEDAFAKVTAMDNSHSRVWAEMSRVCLLAVPPRVSDAQAYANEAFQRGIDDRQALAELAESFVGVAVALDGDMGTIAAANSTACRCLRQSLACGEDDEVRQRLCSLLTTRDEKEACQMFLSPRRGPAL